MNKLPSTEIAAILSLPAESGTHHGDFVLNLRSIQVNLTELRVFHEQVTSDRRKIHG